MRCSDGGGFKTSSSWASAHMEMVSVRHLDTIEIGDTHLSACVTMRSKPFSQSLGRAVHIYHSAAARGIMNRLVIEHSWVGRAQNGCPGASQVAQLGFPNLTRGTALRFVSPKHWTRRTAGKDISGEMQASCWL